MIGKRFVDPATEAPAETATTIGALIGSAGDATPNDTDFVATSLTAGGILKKITWTNTKAFLKTYFDTLYATIASLASYVPYTGATSAVVLGAHTLSTTSGVITPKIYPAADSTTAVQINKADGTTNVLNVDTTNARVGIGTVSPGVPLDISYAANGGSGIRITGTGAGVPIVMMSSPTRNWSYRVQGNQGNEFIFRDDTAAASRFIINTSGQMSVSDTPLAVAQMNVRVNTSTFVGLMVQGVSSQSADLLQVRNSDNTILSYINASGNVGVRMATIAATAYLHLAAGTATASTAPLKFTSGTVNTTSEAGAMEFLTDAYYVTTTTGAVRRMLVAGSSGRATAQTAANPSVATFTLGATDASFEVSANVLVTTATTHSFNVTVDYTDEGNTARTVTLNFSTLAGVISNAAITNVAGVVPYEGVPLHIRCKASTAITIKTAGTFTVVTYNVEATIKQIA